MSVEAGRGLDPSPPVDRLSYTITMRSIIPAREALASTDDRPPSAAGSPPWGRTLLRRRLSREAQAARADSSGAVGPQDAGTAEPARLLPTVRSASSRASGASPLSSRSAPCRRSSRSTGLRPHASGQVMLGVPASRLYPPAAPRRCRDVAAARHETRRECGRISAPCAENTIASRARAPCIAHRPAPTFAPPHFPAAIEVLH